MCGIAGAVIPGGLPATAAARMLDALSHRGPDDQGWLAVQDGRMRAGRSRPPAAPVTLLHRRLTILDLSPRGHQPMRRGGLAIVYNGEVVNYRELRAELEALGHAFVSDTDTEVILAAWQQWGAAALSRFVGMFAFALLDLDARDGAGELVLARDAFGIKPLHYTVDGGVAFASTPAALLGLPGMSRSADLHRVAAYLASIPDDAGTRTFFAAIQQVPPGHLVRVGLDGAMGAPECHTDLTPGGRFRGSFAAAAAALRAMILKSVRLHLRSDVPLGIALSGGIDSSGIAAAARAAHPGPLAAYAYIPDDPALSEKAWVDAVAAHVAADVRAVRPAVAGPGAGAALDALLAAQGEPTVSTSPLAQADVYGAAHTDGIKVMLSGQGADELFGGYIHHVAAQAASLLRRGRLVAAGRIIRRLRGHGAGLEHVAAALLPGLSDRARARGAAAPPWLRLDHLPRVRPRRIRGERLQAILADARRTNLPMLLRYEDRSSMAHAVEARVPYLTPELARFAASLPPQYLVGPGGVTKRVLREALRGLVPDAVLDRRDKVGFTTTEADWLREAADWVEEVLRGPVPPFLDAEALRAHWEKVRAGAAPREGFWRTLCLLRWADMHDVAWT